jgi:hypothetical protein
MNKEKGREAYYAGSAREFNILVLRLAGRGSNDIIDSGWSQWTSTMPFPTPKGSYEDGFVSIRFDGVTLLLAIEIVDRRNIVCWSKGWRVATQKPTKPLMPLVTYTGDVTARVVSELFTYTLEVMNRKKQDTWSIMEGAHNEP